METANAATPSGCGVKVIESGLAPMRTMLSAPVRGRRYSCSWLKRFWSSVIRQESRASSRVVGVRGAAHLKRPLISSSASGEGG